MGTPEENVIFTSFDDREIGQNSNPRPGQKEPGDWGGIIFRNDIDLAEGRFNYEQEGIFLNFVGQADLRYGGGNVNVDASQQVVDPIHMIDARPTIRYNSISFSADAALSANPDSFQETNFHAADSRGINYQVEPFTPDYDRVGPDLRGNVLLDNTMNGLFVRISTPAGDRLRRMNVTGRWDDTDVVHVVAENLVIGGKPGGPQLSAETGLHVAQLDAGLKIDPGLVVKLDGSRIETTVGTQLLIEGVPGHDIVLTSLQDERFGAGGTFDTNPSAVNSPSNEPAPGDWGGVYIAPAARGSIDHAVLAYGGGLTRVEGSFAAFNVVESRQGDLRLTNSLLDNNEDGRGGQAEPGRAGAVRTARARSSFAVPSRSSSTT